MEFLKEVFVTEKQGMHMCFLSNWVLILVNQQHKVKFNSSKKKFSTVELFGVKKLANWMSEYK